MRSGAYFYDVARAYRARGAVDGGLRAEIFFDPQTHLANGVPLEAVFGGLTAALAGGARDHGISADPILCFLRDLGADAAGPGLPAALPLPGKLTGLGLGPAPARHPPTPVA